MVIDKNKIAVAILVTATILLIRKRSQVPNYFTLDDIESRGTPPPANLQENAKELLKNINILQKVLFDIDEKHKIVISNTYRTEQHNQDVNGASNSWHKKAGAVDFSVNGMDANQVQNIIIDLVDKGVMKAGGLGRGSSFTHYDIRGYKTSWIYNNGGGSNVSSTSWGYKNTNAGIMPVATNETLFNTDIDY